jgi:hypothetical protein
MAVEPIYTASTAGSDTPALCRTPRPTTQIHPRAPAAAGRRRPRAPQQRPEPFVPRPGPAEPGPAQPGPADQPFLAPTCRKTAAAASAAARCAPENVLVHGNFTLAWGEPSLRLHSEPSRPGVGRPGAVRRAHRRRRYDPLGAPPPRAARSPGPDLCAEAAAVSGCGCGGGARTERVG